MCMCMCVYVCVFVCRTVVECKEAHGAHWKRCTGRDGSDLGAA
jgi:hypothetical protein